MAILLSMLLVGCVSPEVVTVEKVVIPEIAFPTFPLSEEMTDNKDGTVTVSADWIVRLEEYHIKITATEENYAGLREIYEKFYE